jgi:hypothetical protein
MNSKSPKEGAAAAFSYTQQSSRDRLPSVEEETPPGHRQVGCWPREAQTPEVVWFPSSISSTSSSHKNPHREEAPRNRRRKDNTESHERYMYTTMDTDDDLSSHDSKIDTVTMEFSSRCSLFKSISSGTFSSCERIDESQETTPDYVIMPTSFKVVKPRPSRFKPT